jgi:hypothetical protein
MNDMIEAAQAVEKMGVTGILGGLVLALGLVIKMLWKVREDCIEKLLKKGKGG